MARKNTMISDTWDDMFASASYFSPKPSTMYGYRMPTASRADTDPNLNGQPAWARSVQFAMSDNSAKSIPQSPNMRSKRGR